MQIAKSFDPITLQKIKKSALLGSAGFLASAITILLADPSVIAFLQKHMLLGAAVTAYVPVIISSIHNWMKGQEDASGKS